MAEAPRPKRARLPFTSAGYRRPGLSRFKRRVDRSAPRPAAAGGWWPMDFVPEMRRKASGNPRRLVLPEGEEPRIFKAARSLLDEKLAAEVVLLGSRDGIAAKAKSEGVSLKGIRIVDPAVLAGPGRVRRRILRAAQAERRHPRAGPRGHDRRRPALGRDDGPTRPGRRDGRRRHQPDGQAAARGPRRHPDEPGHKGRLLLLRDVPPGPQVGRRRPHDLRRLRHRPRPGRGAARGDRNRLGQILPLVPRARSPWSPCSPFRPRGAPSTPGRKR